MIGKAHLIVQLDGTDNGSVLLVFKGLIKTLETTFKTISNSDYVKLGIRNPEFIPIGERSKRMAIDSSIIIDDFVRLDSFKIGFMEEVFEKALKSAGFRAVAASKKELEKILERQIEF